MRIGRIKENERKVNAPIRANPSVISRVAWPIPASNV